MQQTNVRTSFGVSKEMEMSEKKPYVEIYARDGYSLKMNIEDISDVYFVILFLMTAFIRKSDSVSVVEEAEGG